MNNNEINLDNPSVSDVVLSFGRDTPLAGSTPEERFEGFMTGYAHLTPEEVKLIREVMRPEFGLPPEDPVAEGGVER